MMINTASSAAASPTPTSVLVIGVTAEFGKIVRLASGERPVLTFGK